MKSVGRICDAAARVRRRLLESRVAFVVLLFVLLLLLPFSDWPEVTLDWLNSNPGVIAALVLVAVLFRQMYEVQRDGMTHDDSLERLYLDGARMSGSNSLTTQTAGIDVLSRLAKEYPTQYDTRVKLLLDAVERESGSDPNSNGPGYG